MYCALWRPPERICEANPRLFLQNKHDILTDMNYKTDLIFSFVTEDGIEKMNLQQYEERKDLHAIFGRQSTPPVGRQTLFLGRDIFSFTHEYLKQNVKKAKAFEEARRLYEAHPLKYFVPQTQTVIDFLNWPDGKRDSSMKVLHSGVGSGKSVAGVIDWLLDIVPSESDWPMFEFGVQRREYGGALKEGGVAIMSYQMTNHQNTLWPQVIRRWCPQKYILPYINGEKTISWRLNPQISIADTMVYFMVYGQRETAFTSQALDIIHWDEQTKESIFNNANDRVQRRGGRHIMTMTPHAVEGNPETGAGSFIDRIRKGELDTALNVRFFQMNKLDANPWVVTPEDKESCMEEYINAPLRQGNKKKLAEGKSKVYGDFHESSGLVLDDWSRDIHVIEPFEVPNWWSFYRYHDHGRKEPNAAILVAVDDEDNYFIINEWYGRDLEISANAKGIVEDMSGNSIEDNEFGKQEKMTEREIVYTVSDPRSLSKALDNAYHTIQQEYSRSGLELRHGSGQTPDKLVPLLGELLRVDSNRTHYSHKTDGAPRLYVFNTCREFIKEAEGWRMKKVRVGGAGGVGVAEKPEPKNDHLMTCALLLAEDRPMWIPKKKLDNDFWEEDNIEEDTANCPLSGY